MEIHVLIHKESNTNSYIMGHLLISNRVQNLLRTWDKQSGDIWVIDQDQYITKSSLDTYKAKTRNNKKNALA